VVAQTAAMHPADVEQIARLVLRDYALPLRFDAITHESAGQCTVDFLERYGGAKRRVAVWCDGKVSAHNVRESLKRGLDVTD
jgi:hypothetical protein